MLLKGKTERIKLKLFVRVICNLIAYFDLLKHQTGDWRQRQTLRGFTWKIKINKNNIICGVNKDIVAFIKIG